MPFEDYMTAREVAKTLGMKPGAVTRAIQRNRFEGAVKKDWFWLVPRKTVESIKRQKRKAKRAAK